MAGRRAAAVRALSAAIAVSASVEAGKRVWRCRQGWDGVGRGGHKWRRRGVGAGVLSSTRAARAQQGEKKEEGEGREMKKKGRRKRKKEREREKKERERDSVSAGFAAAVGHARAAAFGRSATSTRNEEKIGQ